MSAAQPAQANGPLRLTHVVFDFNGGGMETLIAEMAARMRQSAIKVSLITLSGREGRLGARTRHYFDRFDVIRPKSRLSLLAPISVARAIRRTGAHVVHLHSGCWFKGVRAARMAGVPCVVYTEHGRQSDDLWSRRWMDRRAAAQTDAVVAVSRELGEYMRTHVGISASKVTTIQNGVDTDAFVPSAPSAELRRSLGIPDDALVVGSVGRLEPVKAYDRLLDAVAVLRRTTSLPVVAVLCGDGSQRDRLREHAHRLGIADAVHLPGWSNDTARFYSILDVFVLSSLSEGQSISLMEAMASGICPVVTDVGGNAEVIGPDLRDCLVPSGDVEGLAGRIARSLTDPHRDEKKRRVRQRAIDAFSLNGVVTNYERLYRRLLDEQVSVS